MLLGAYFAVAFGLRTYLQFHRTGSSGFRGISGPIGSAGWFGGVLFVLALIASIAAPVLAWKGLDPPLLRPTDVLDAIGASTFGVGTFFLFWSQSAMGSSWRIGVDDDEQTELVTTGPFAWVRNPIFSGMMLSALGFLAFLPNRLAIAAYLVLVIAIELQVRFVEEPYLLRTHGQPYADYLRRVGRFVPWLGRT